MHEHKKLSDLEKERFDRSLSGWRARSELERENLNAFITELEQRKVDQSAMLATERDNANIVDIVRDICKLLLAAGVPLPKLSPPWTWDELRKFAKWARMRLSAGELEQLIRVRDAWLESVECKAGTGVAPEERVKQLLGGLVTLVAALMAGYAVPPAWVELVERQRQMSAALDPFDDGPP